MMFTFQSWKQGYAIQGYLIFLTAMGCDTPGEGFLCPEDKLEIKYFSCMAQTKAASTQNHGICKVRLVTTAMGREKGSTVKYISIYLHTHFVVFLVFCVLFGMN